MEQCNTKLAVTTDVNHPLQDLDDLRGIDLFCDSQISSPEQLTVTLLKSDLWSKFCQVGTEMVINKSGRRMFPQPEVTISGLEPYGLYSVALRLQPVSQQRFAYSMVAGWGIVGISPEYEGFATPRGNSFIHPRSPCLGVYWNSEHLSFTKLKLTNDITKHGLPSYVVLRSMHKYRLVIDVTQYMEDGSSTHMSFTLPDTEFMAVTAYQNPDLTKLKIEHNPFARAFRHGSWYGKRKRSQDDVDGSGRTTPSEGSECGSQSPQEKPYIPFNYMNSVLNPSVKVSNPPLSWVSYLCSHPSLWHMPLPPPAHLQMPKLTTPVQMQLPKLCPTLLPLPSANTTLQDSNEPFDFSMPKSRT